MLKFKAYDVSIFNLQKYYLQNLKTKLIWQINSNVRKVKNKIVKVYNKVQKFYK